jgi:hypothetical protein
MDLGGERFRGERRLKGAGIQEKMGRVEDGPGQMNETQEETGEREKARTGGGSRRR